MRDFDTLTFHPLAERIVDILCKKTQNDNPNFFRILVSYYLAKIAASMRVKIATQDRGEIPVNVYALNLAPSGFSKDFSSNIMEEDLLAPFKSVFYSDTYPLISEESIYKLAAERAMIEDIEEEESLTLVQKEFKELGELAFSFDSGTPAAIKQMRHKLLMSNVGSVNLEINEIGSNLIGNSDALNTFLELYDVGKIKQKLTKNTKENTRSKEIDGRTPTNLMMYGTPDKLFDGSKIEDEFYSFLETGYGRRFFFGFATLSNKNTALTPEEIFDILTDPVVNQDLKDLSVKFSKLASIVNHNKIISVDKKVSILVIAYRLYCEERANQMKEHQGIAKAEMSHRYFKTLKLAGAYAFVDGDSEITEDNYYHAICMAEESGKAFEQIMTRDGIYVKLAKYIGSIGREVTHVELQEDLPFYKGSNAVKADLIQLASAWGYKNHTLIKRSIIHGIEFFSGEQLQETDLKNLNLSYSNNISDGYTNALVEWEDLHKLTQEPYMHWINHYSSNGHRSEDHMKAGFDLLVLDVDGTASIDECAALLKDYKFFAHTTKRHTDDTHRFRLVMPMNYHLKLNQADYRLFMANIYEWLPVEVDTQTAQRSRKWATYNGDYIYNDGENLVDARLFIPKTSKNDEHMAFIATYQSMTNMERWFLTNSINGSRNNQLSRYALMMVDLGYDLGTIENNVLEMNSKLADGLSIKEIKATIIVSAARKLGKKN